MSDKKPKLEFPTNVPVTVKLLKNFWHGENEYGKSWGWSVEHDGVEKSVFAKEALQKHLEEFGPGSTIIITLAETKNEQGKAYKQWKVSPAIFDEKGNLEVPQKDIVKDPEARDEWRETRKRHMKEAIKDAADVVAAFNAYVGEEGNGLVNLALGPEDMRAIAISFMIEEQRKSR